MEKSFNSSFCEGVVRAFIAKGQAVMFQTTQGANIRHGSDLGEAVMVIFGA